MSELADFDDGTEFQEEISVMPSLVKPKRVTIRGSDGSLYSFLCKPKDDLRKDARLMDFFSMVNKLLKADSESRRRRLRVYCTITELFGDCFLTVSPLRYSDVRRVAAERDLRLNRVGAERCSYESNLAQTVRGERDKLIRESQQYEYIRLTFNPAMRIRQEPQRPRNIGGCS